MRRSTAEEGEGYRGCGGAGGFRRLHEEEGEWDWIHGADASALRGTGDALKGVRIERMNGGVCTQQSMLGRVRGPSRGFRWLTSP